MVEIDANSEKVETGFSRREKLLSLSFKSCYYLGSLKKRLARIGRKISIVSLEIVLIVEFFPKQGEGGEEGVPIRDGSLVAFVKEANDFSWRA